MTQPVQYPSLGQAIGLLLLAVLLTIGSGVIIGIAGTVFRTPLVGHPATLAAAELVTLGLVLWWGVSRARAPLGEVFPLGRVRSGLHGPMLVTLLGASVMISEADNLFRRVVPAPESLAGLFADLTTGGTSLWGSLLALVIVAPLTEELVFRGLILRGLLSRYRAWTAVSVSAILFGVFHLNPWQLIGATGLGVLFAWWRVHTGSLVPGLAGHALNNGLPLIVTRALGLAIPGYTMPGYTSGVESTQLQPLWFDLTGLALLVAGVVWTARLFARARTGQAGVSDASVARS